MTREEQLEQNHKQLEELLRPFRNKRGKIPTRGKQAGYLKTETGRDILELVEKLDMPWPEVENLLCRSQSAIEKARCYHRLRKKRAAHIVHSEERVKLIRDYYKKSKSICTRKESGALFSKLVKRFNALSGPHTSRNAVKMIAHSMDLKWGYSGKKTEKWNEEKKKLFASLYESGVHHSEITSHPSFRSEFKGIESAAASVKACAEQIGCSHGKRKKTLAEEEEKRKEQRDDEDRKIFDRILNDDSLPLEEKKIAFARAMPQRKSWRSIQMRARELGYKINPQSKKSKNWWENPAITARISALIEQERVLVETTIADGVRKIVDVIKKEYPETARKKSGESFNFTSVNKRLDEFVWTQERVKSLSEIMQADLSLDVFCENYPYIPRKMAERKADRMTGLVSSSRGMRTSLRGMGRLDLGEISPKELLRFKLPSATFREPYKIPAKDRASVMVLVPNVGIIFRRESIDANVTRRALAEARYRGASAVVVSSLFDIDVTKAAGANKVYRALVSGLRTKTSNLAEIYQDEAKRILDKQKLSSRDVELVYMTFAERFNTILNAWETVSYRPKDESRPELGTEPEFDGPILVIFGFKEELLITSVAYAEARRATIKKLNKIIAEQRVAERALCEAQRLIRPKEEIEQKEARVDQLEDERNRTIITNVPDDLFRLMYRRTRAGVVKKIEETIPNSKVISVGSCSIQVGDNEAWKTGFHVPDDLKVSYSHLEKFVASHGPKVLREEMPPTNVILHPHALFFEEATRERDAKGERDMPARIYMAPIALDSAYVRSRLGDTIRKVHPVSKVVFNEQFKPGVLMLDYNNETVNGYPLPIESLAQSEELQKKAGVDTARTHVPLMHDPVLRYIYLLTITDPHYGSRNRETNLWCDESQKYLGVDEAFFHLLRRSKLPNTSDFPFHMFAMNDDPVQGNHLLMWQTQPHPNELPQWKIEEKLRQYREEIESAESRHERSACAREMQQFVLRQFALRPPDWLQNQLKMACHYHVDANMDVFGSIVKKAVDARLIFKGVSQFSGNESDDRDIGCINSGSGNHGLKTLNRELTEGWIIADRILLRLLRAPEWADKEEELASLIKAPLYSNRFMAWGTMQAPGCYEYAFDLRDSPPKMKGWNNTLAGWMRVDPSRGNIQRFAEGKFTIKTCGDKHFHASGIVPYALYMMCAPGTHTDLFAEMAGGLPPNNTGISIVGMPKDGPNSGPFIIRYLPFKWLKDRVENPAVPIDWKALFPSPL